jgi:hypothetical protein
LPGLGPSTLPDTNATAVIGTLLTLRNLEYIKTQEHNYKGKTFFFGGERN